jgi:kynurenine formamidase
MADLPRYDELPLVNGHRASWGLWGHPDYFGCLNLLTPDRVVAASRQVRTGQVFPMNWDMRKPDPPLFNRARFEHEVTGAPGGMSHDDVLHGWNTQSSSQWDGFRHIRNEPSGHYDGVPDEEHGMHHWAERGIAGRCVLADVARWRASVNRSLDYLASDPITPDDISATLAAQGTTVEVGDVLLMRTGWCGWYEQQTTETRERIVDRTVMVTPGLRPGPDMAEFLWNLHISAIGADNPAVEVWPPGALVGPEVTAEIRADLSRMHEIFNHTIFLPMLGLPLGEMWQLDRLADACAADGRYEAMFVSAPLNLPNGVASPPNALVLR